MGRERVDLQCGRHQLAAELAPPLRQHHAAPAVVLPILDAPDQPVALHALQRARRGRLLDLLAAAQLLLGEALLLPEQQQHRPLRDRDSVTAQPLLQRAGEEARGERDEVGSALLDHERRGAVRFGSASRRRPATYDGI